MHLRTACGRTEQQGRHVRIRREYPIRTGTVAGAIPRAAAAPALNWGTKGTSAALLAILIVPVIYQVLHLHRHT
ncbi:MAG TPA: hypothetical protein VF788_09565 [Pseudonocardiaceae bacterium]